MDAEDNTEAPQLLSGIDFATDVEERRQGKYLYKPEEGGSKLFAEDEENDIDPAGAFRDHSAKAKQILFKEREVDNMMSMIYGASMDDMKVEMEGDDSEDDDMTGGALDTNLDTNRFDVAPEKLRMYKDSAVKRKLKTKFVTGQGSDQIIKNLLD